MSLTFKSKDDDKPVPESTAGTTVQSGTAQPKKVTDSEKRKKARENHSDSSETRKLQKSTGQLVGSAVLPCVNKSHKDKKEKKKEEKKEPKKDIDTVTINCEHGDRSYPSAIPYLDLVPNSGDITGNEIDKVNVVWSGPKYPGDITISPETEVKGKGNYEIAFEYRSRKEKPPEGVGLSDIWDAIWTYGQPPTNYTIKGMPTGGLPVNVYNPDQYKLIINIPKFDGYSVGSKLGGGFEAAAPTGDKSQEIDSPIKLERNSSPLTSPLIIDALDSLAAVINLGVSVYNIIETIKDNVPKVGWYADFDIQFFVGAFELEWGWKEHTNHKAYYGSAANININLISGSLEIGFGFSGCSFEAQIFGMLSGEINAALSFEHSTPDANNVLGEITGFLGGRLGTRFEAGYVLRVEAANNTKIVGKGNIEYVISTGLQSEVVIDWSGIKAKVEFGIGKGNFLATKKGSASKTCDLVPGKELKRFKWPSDEKYKPVVLSQNEIYSIVLRVLDNGWDVNIYKESKDWYRWNTRIDNEAIANKISKKIYNREDIKKDSKSIEGLAHEIRSVFVEKSKRWLRDSMYLKEFDIFMESGIDELMDNRKGPIKNFVKQLK